MRWTLAGVLVSAALAAVKLMAGVLGDSYALIADGMESLLDIVSSFVVWGGLRIASHPPDADHPYGHGKAEPLTAMAVAVALLGGAVALAVMSVREILVPHHPPQPFTLAVLVAVIAAKEVLSRKLRRVGESVGSTAVKTDAWHHRSDAITSAAAFAGISIALLLGKGYESADDWAALFACGIIAWNGTRLIRPALAEVMDAAAPVEVEGRVREVAGGIQGVAAVEKCRVRKSGFDLFVDIHVEVDGGLTVRQGHTIAHQVKDALLAAGLGIRDALVHVEPAPPR
ncbi:MAG: cation transporter [Planctomycetes bacterium]|nr:cation transporter [Planctomycetota bacterium]